MPNVRLDVRRRHGMAERWEKVASEKGAGALGRLKKRATELEAGSFWRIFSPTVGITILDGVTA